ncbi:hypothetical protein [Streptomyces albidoflavus]|uniref:hypothetical protein n=1 Tax=Streptomyces albidoflavus TaxID=1886 RepID=UPI003319433C
MITLYLGPGHDDAPVSYADMTLCPPPTATPETLGELLDAVSPRLRDGGALHLAGPWTKLLAPFTEHPEDGTHTVTSGRWSARAQDGDTWLRWTTGAGDSRRTIWTGEVDAIEPGDRDTPLIAEHPFVTAVHLAQWARRTGHPWTGVPAMTGNGLLVDSIGRGRNAPYWAPRQGEWKLGDIERPYSHADWAPPHVPLGEFEHAYDLNLAYLSACINAELPADQLQPSGPREFDRSEGGLWRADLSPWTHAHLPDPAGYAPALPDGTRWVTTPTLTLLDELERQGLYGGFAIREARTAPGRRVTRAWGTQLRDIIQNPDTTEQSTAARRVYKSTYGLWRRGGLVNRPDWHYSIIALARVNLWRKLRAAADAGHVLAGLDATDAVRYRSDSPDWATAAPLPWNLDPSGLRLGAFKPGRGTYVPPAPMPEPQPEPEETP